MLILDIMRIKPIKELIPENLIDYNQLRIIIAIFEYEYGISEQNVAQNAGIIIFLN